MEDRYKNIKKKYKATEDTLIVIVDEVPEKKSAAGVIIADTQELTRKQSSITSGIVLHVSPQAYLSRYDKQTVKEGDHVLFAKYGGIEIFELDDNGKCISLRWLYSDDIYGFINGDLPDQSVLKPKDEDLTGVDLAFDSVEENNRRMYEAYKKQVAGRKDASTLLHQFARKLG